MSNFIRWQRSNWNSTANTSGKSIYSAVHNTEAFNTLIEVDGFEFEFKEDKVCCSLQNVTSDAVDCK